MDKSSPKEIAQLDFVFIDTRGSAYRVRTVGEECWLHGMHASGLSWVSMRKVTDSTELWRMQNECLDWSEHEKYELGVPFNPEHWTSYDAPRKRGNNG